MPGVIPAQWKAWTTQSNAQQRRRGQDIPGKEAPRHVYRPPHRRKRSRNRRKVQDQLKGRPRHLEQAHMGRGDPAPVGRRGEARDAVAAADDQVHVRQLPRTFVVVPCSVGGDLRE